MSLFSLSPNHMVLCNTSYKKTQLRGPSLFFRIEQLAFIKGAMIKPGFFGARDPYQQATHLLGNSFCLLSTNHRNQAPTCQRLLNRPVFKDSAGVHTLCCAWNPEGKSEMPPKMALWSPRTCNLVLLTWPKERLHK